MKYKQNFISHVWKDQLYKYITGVVQNQGHKMIVINGMPDHLHLLLGQRPVQSISELMQDIKGSSSKWINECGFTSKKFVWQEGYGAFSYSKSDLSKVIKYIVNQEEHHCIKNFRRSILICSRNSKLITMNDMF